MCIMGKMCASFLYYIFSRNILANSEEIETSFQANILDFDLLNLVFPTKLLNDSHELLR